MKIKEKKQKADEFYVLICEWFKLMEELSKNKCGIEEMKKIIPILSNLIISVVELMPICNKLNYRKIPEDCYKYDDIGFIRFDEKYRHYEMILQPYIHVLYPDELKDEPCTCDMNDDINDISKDLLVGKNVYERLDKNTALWVWCDLYRMHWGKFHALQLLYAMQQAIIEYYDEDERKRMS